MQLLKFTKQNVKAEKRYSLCQTAEFVAMLVQGCHRDEFKERKEGFAASSTKSWIFAVTFEKNKFFTPVTRKIKKKIKNQQ